MDEMALSDYYWFRRPWRGTRFIICFGVQMALGQKVVMRENKRVVLFVPKAAREAVWEPRIRKYWAVF